jgi:hypothetical protein
MHFGIGSCATANAVAWGGCEWRQARTSGRALRTDRCRRISLDRFFVPATCLPSRSTTQRSSGFMNPFEMRVGVQRTRSSLRRKLMLPSLAATNPFA